MHARNAEGKCARIIDAYSALNDAGDAAEVASRIANFRSPPSFSSYLSPSLPSSVNSSTRTENSRSRWFEAEERRRGGKLRPRRTKFARPRSRSREFTIGRKFSRQNPAQNEAEARDRAAPRACPAAPPQRVNLLHITYTVQM